jgi:uncharacterized protein YihD (DUF1040 family)
MSSFDYTDNFSGFNDLFNRIEILQEKDWKSMVGAGKFRPEFQLYKAEDPKTGEKAPPGGLSRLANLLYITALGEAHLDMISGEVAAKLARRSTSSTEIAKILAKIDPEVFEELFNDENPKSAEVAEYVNNPENRPKLVQYIIKNYTPKDREFIKDVTRGDPKDLDDAVGDAVDDIENAADTISGDFKKEIDEIVSADPTTFIEIKIQDMDRAEDVSKMVSRYANEDGVEITNDGVQFSIDPEMPLAIAAKNLALKGLEQKIESGLQSDISRVTDNIVILHLPQKVIDQAETELRFKDLPGAEEDYEQIDDEEYEGPSMANNPGGAPSSYAQGEEGGGLTTPEDAEDEFNHEKWKKKFMKSVRKDNRGKSRRLLQKRDARGAGPIRSLEEPTSPAPEESAYDPARGAGLGAKGVVKPANPIKTAIKAGVGPILSPLVGDEEEKDLDDFLTKEQPEDYIPATDYEEVLDDLIHKDKKKHALKKLYDEEEEFSYSPMLESHKTSTSAYLTEQAASDKRNKKTEVKKQSFKEKYKPKTHWQLEELRRYGL